MPRNDHTLRTFHLTYAGNEKSRFQDRHVEAQYTPFNAMIIGFRILMRGYYETKEGIPIAMECIDRRGALPCT